MIEFRLLEYHELVDLQQTGVLTKDTEFASGMFINNTMYAVTSGKLDDGVVYILSTKSLENYSVKEEFLEALVRSTLSFVLDAGNNSAIFDGNPLYDRLEIQKTEFGYKLDDIQAFFARPCKSSRGKI